MPYVHTFWMGEVETMVPAKPESAEPVVENCLYMLGRSDALSGVVDKEDRPRLYRSCPQEWN